LKLASWPNSFAATDPAFTFYALTHPLPFADLRRIPDGMLLSKKIRENLRNLRITSADGVPALRIPL
jgi:hypothetical protein